MCTSLLSLLIVASFATDVSASSAILIEASSGDVVFEKNAYNRMPMASTTKIMTGLLAIESGRLQETVTVSEKMIGAEGSSVYLKVGEKLHLKDLVYALMLASANDAAEAIAVFLCGSVEGFALKMNDRAKSMGLEDTSFANPHGLDHKDHYTTAYDLSKLTCEALKNEVFRDIVSTYRYRIPDNGVSPERCLVNHNKLLASYEGSIGVKTGYTKKCGRCLVSAAERDGVILVCVTLSAPDDWNDHKKMLDMGFDKYSCVTLAQSGSLRFELPVICGVESKIAVSNKDKVELVMKKEDRRINCNIHSLKGHFIFAPIHKGDHIADAVFTSDGKELARVPLYAENSIELLETKKKFFDFFNFGI